LLEKFSISGKDYLGMNDRTKVMNKFNMQVVADELLRDWVVPISDKALELFF
jgi:hypothetical protein